MSSQPSTERGEWRAALLTYVPAIAVAFFLNRVLVSAADWAPRRALLVSIGAGIVLALVLQRRWRRDGGAG